MKKLLIAVAGLALVAALVIPAVAADGKALYESKCAMCHGKDGVAKPMAKGSGNFNDPEYQKANTVEKIAQVTADGVGKMPAYKDKMSAEEIKAVATYIKTMAGGK